MKKQQKGRVEERWAQVVALKRVIGECYFGGKEKFWNEIEVEVAQHCECSRFHFIIHLKLVNFLLYLFHF